MYIGFVCFEQFVKELDIMGSKFIVLRMRGFLNILAHHVKFVGDIMKCITSLSYHVEDSYGGYEKQTRW